MAGKYVIDLPDNSEVFDVEDVIIRENENGIAVTPRSGKKLGFLRQFFPWSEVRRFTRTDD